MKRWILLAVALCILGLLTPWMRDGGAKPHELVAVLLGVLNLAILGWTLREMLRYTKENMKMHQAVTHQSEELARQVRFSIMPSFAAKIGHTGRVRTDELFLFLWNAGNGSALNVRIDPVRPAIDGVGDSDYEIQFKTITYLVPGTGPLEVIHKYILHDNPNHPLHSAGGWVGAREMQYLNKERPLRITFQDIEGNEYEQVLRVDAYGCEPEPVRLVRSMNHLPPFERKSEPLTSVTMELRSELRNSESRVTAQEQRPL